MRSRLFSLGIVLAALLPAQVLATTIIPPSFEQLADRAEVVFMGAVAGSRAEWRTVGQKQVIMTWVDFRVEEVWKGKAMETITLQFLGGTIGDRTLQVEGVPRFSPGERVLLFVENNGLQFSPLIGAHHGKFALRKDGAGGADRVFQHDGTPLSDVRQIGNDRRAASGRVQINPNAIAGSSLTTAEFKQRLRAHLEKRRAYP